MATVVPGGVCIHLPKLDISDHSIKTREYHRGLLFLRSMLSSSTNSNSMESGNGSQSRQGLTPRHLLYTLHRQWVEVPILHLDPGQLWTFDHSAAPCVGTYRMCRAASNQIGY